MKFLRLFIVFGISIQFSTAWSQDNLFSIKSGNLNHFNPALMGTISDFSSVMNSRIQWPNSDLKNRTKSLLVNKNFENDFGLGFEIKNDEVFLFQNIDYKINGNYLFAKNDLTFKIGANVGIRTSKIHSENEDYQKFYNSLDSTQRSELSDELSFAPIFDLGFAGNYKKLLFGLSTMQVNQPSFDYSIIGDRQYKTRIVGLLGYKIQVNDVNLVGLGTIQYQGKSSVLDLQSNGQYKNFKLGVGYRQNFGEFGNLDWVFANAEYKINPLNLAFGYGYDRVLSNVSQFGTHEFYLRYVAQGYKEDNKLSRWINTLL